MRAHPPIAPYELLELFTEYEESLKAGGLVEVIYPPHALPLAEFMAKRLNDDSE